MSSNTGSMRRDYENIVVLGASYVGLAAAKELSELADAAAAETKGPRYRVVLVEQHSHFGHSFVWPRFAIAPGHEHKSFIPYTKSLKLPHRIVHAAAVHLDSGLVQLDRPVDLGDQEHEQSGSGVNSIPYEACVVATGTRLRPPGNMPGDGSKKDGVAYLQSIQRDLKQAKRIVILGGGAVGVQMATDLAVIYNQDASSNDETKKTITIVQSRAQFMPAFDPALDQIVRARFEELGIQTVTGSRAIVPQSGFNTAPGPQLIKLQDGRELEADYVITATGQTPASKLLSSIAPSAIDPSLFVRVSKALQVQPEDHKEIEALDGRVWALGDVANTGAPKAARPGMAQAKVVAGNVFKSLQARRENKEPPAFEEYNPDPAAIHLTLGVIESVVFRNPSRAGAGDHWVKERVDGKLDMGVEGVWDRRAPGLVEKQDDYWL